MKASLLRASGEAPLAGPWPQLRGATKEVDTQMDAVSSEEGLEAFAGRPTTVRLGVAVSLLDAVTTQDTALDLVRRTNGPIALLA